MTLLALAVDQPIVFGADPTPLTGRALLVAAVVVGLLAAAAWALRRSAPMRRGRQAVTIETAVSLGDRRSLVIVAIEGRRLLLGSTPTQVALITELGAGDAPPPFGAALDASLQPERPR